MTSRDFVFWLQGYFEILDPKGEAGHSLPLGPVQVKCIYEHLQLVFTHGINPPVAPITWGTTSTTFPSTTTTTGTVRIPGTHEFVPDPTDVKFC